MARRESDREDILREATALVERVELSVPGQGEPVVVGFRRNGSGSVFFGSDPVYQFNSAGELRRAYVGGLLYKAEQGRLVELRRQRTAAEVQLIRRELADNERDAFLRTVENQLQDIAARLQRGDVLIQRQVPKDAKLLPRIRQWLEELPRPIAIARAPNVR